MQGGNQAGSNGPVPLARPHATPQSSWGAGGTSSGSITVPGSGDWTLVRNSTGNYTVTFTSPYNSPPAVSVDIAANGVGGNNHQAYVMPEPTVNGFTVLTANGTTAADLEFHFVAMATN